jgi:hypothetical protein
MRLLYGPPWWRGGRYPDKPARSALIKLYHSDRNICHDPSILQRTLDALSCNDTMTAQNYLAEIANSKRQNDQQKLASWYRAFIQQVKAGETEAAVSGIQGDLRSLQDELNSSPWHRPSLAYDEYASKSQWVGFPGTSFWIEPADAILVTRSSDTTESSAREDASESGEVGDADETEGVDQTPESDELSEGRGNGDEEEGSESDRDDEQEYGLPCENDEERRVSRLLDRRSTLNMAYSSTITRSTLLAHVSFFKGMNEVGR